MRWTTTAIAAALALAAQGCRDTPPPGRAPPARAGRSASRPAPATAPAPTTARAAATAPAAPATQPAATRPAATQASADFDAELAKVLALTEQAEFFEAMRACRDMRMTFMGDPRSGLLPPLAARLKEYRRAAPEMADAVRKLTSDQPEARRIAAETLRAAGELGGIYLRNALRGGTDAAAAEAGALLAATRDANTPPILLARLEEGPKPPAADAMMESLTALIPRTAPGELRKAHAACLAATGRKQAAWLTYLGAVLTRRCGGSGEELDKLLGSPGAHEKLKALAVAAGDSADPAVAAFAWRLAVPFGLPIGSADCVLWLRSDVGVKLNAGGRVVEWADRSRAGNHATQQETGKWPRRNAPTEGRPPSVEFDGLNDHLILPAGFADFSRGVTVAVWAYPTSHARWGRFIDLGNGDTTDSIVFARRDTSYDLAFQVCVGKQVGTAAAPKAIESNVWQHLAATQDEAGRVVLYRNGEPVGKGQVPVAAKPVARKLNFIARSSRDGDEYYRGFLDEVRVFRRGLSAEEIKCIYERTKARRSPP